MIKLSKEIYVAQANSTGGREGHITSENKVLNLKMDFPKEAGGRGDEDATNPEQLFAAGYAACFTSTVSLMARQHKIHLKTPIRTEGLVTFGNDSDGGYGLAVKLKVFIPEITEDVALKLLEEAHRNCPYSKSVKDNIAVIIELVQ